MMTSSVQQRGPVPFPAFLGERVYMREFTKRDGLPADLQRWQETVDAMLDDIDTDGPVYLMVDQGFVKAGATQRRPGLHVDGYWHAPIRAHHDGGRGGHSADPPPAPMPPQRPAHRGPMHLHHANGDESILLAASDLGCRALVGAYDGTWREGGDCSHVDVAGLLPVDMEPGRLWAGNALTMLHESLPAQRDCLRTVVRLNVPGWVPK